MAYTPTRLYQGQAAATETTLYTAAGNGAIVKEVVACNTSGATVTLSFSVVPTGGTAGAANRLLGAVPIAAGATQVFSFSTVMAASDFLSALASTASAVTLTVSGVAL